jgi:hypothetical protein
VLQLTIESIRKYVANPLETLWILTPRASTAVRAMAGRTGCRVVDDSFILPFPKRLKRLIVRDTDRSGWLYQQLLKLCLNEALNIQDCIVVDADTVFIRPCAWHTNGRMILRCSDELHRPYYDVYERLLGEQTQRNISFVAHNMLFNRDTVARLKRAIESYCGTDWASAILNRIDWSEPSGFSEYETYGHYLYSHNPQNVSLTYWNNLALARKAIEPLRNLSMRYSSVYESISFHHYL